MTRRAPAKMLVWGAAALIAGGFPGHVPGPVGQPLNAIQGVALAQATNETTPSHVFQVVSNLINELEVLREAMGAMDYPLEAEPVTDRSPIHVYSRSLEVRRKIADTQRRFGLVPGEVDQIPVKLIEPRDVFESIQVALAEVRRTKQELFIEDAVDSAPFVGGKTPSLVYQHLGDASFMLDALVGRPTDINDVYANLMYLQGDMELVATRLRISLEMDPPAVDGRKRLKEVAQQIMRATFKIINLQTRLGMDASAVPQVTLVRVVPANIYEAINIMKAEMVRIKVHLGIQLPHAEPPASRNQRPRDVFAQALLLIRNLDRLAGAAGNFRG